MGSRNVNKTCDYIFLSSFDCGNGGYINGFIKDNLIMESQATKEELEEGKRKCWSPKCNKTAIIEDKAGWRWCLKHYWEHRDGYFSKARKIIWNNLFK